MKRFLILLSLLFCNTVYADTITINWGVDNQLYSTTTCEIGNDVVLPNTPTKRGHIFRGWTAEHFDRGTWLDWANVPRNANLYSKDYTGNTEPLKNDYMVVEDTSDYYTDFNDVTSDPTAGYLNIPYDGIIDNGSWKTSSYMKAIPEKTIVFSWTRVYTGAAGSGMTGFYNSNKQFIGGRKGPVTYDAGNYSQSFEVPDGTKYIRVSYLPSDFNIVLRYSDSPSYNGSWRFIYDGVWETDGVSGWKPDYQIVSE